MLFRNAVLLLLAGAFLDQQSLFYHIPQDQNSRCLGYLQLPLNISFYEVDLEPIQSTDQSDPP